jgi:predicted transcriptional regulator
MPCSRKIARTLVTKELTMNSHTAKQEAIEAIQRQPDTVDIEEIMYRLYVLENIRRGQQDAEAGKTSSAEQVLRDIQTW